MMKPDGMGTPRPWQYVFSAVFHLWMGLTMLTNAMSDLQNEYADFDDGVWPVFIRWGMVILFALGWRFSFLFERFNRPLNEKWDFIVSIVFFPVLGLIAVIYMILSPPNFVLPILVASMTFFFSGAYFNVASTLRLKISKPETE